jgi:ATP-dependent DNA helicase RecQ
MTRSVKALYVLRIQGSPNPHVRFLEKNDFTHITTADKSAINRFNENVSVFILGMEALFFLCLDFPPGPFYTQATIVTECHGQSHYHKRKRITSIFKNKHHQTIAMFSNKGRAKWHDQTLLHARVLGMIRRHKTDDEHHDDKQEKIAPWELLAVEIFHKHTRKIGLQKNSTYGKQLFYLD